MNKFQKRIAKNIKKSPIDCLIIGDGFGHIDDFLGMFNTVFLFDNKVEKKAKNLIQRIEIKAVFNLKNISSIFIDGDKINHIDSLSPLLTTSWPDLFVEGNDVLGREHTKLLYQIGYRAISQLDFCHQWSKTE